MAAFCVVRRRSARPCHARPFLDPAYCSRGDGLGRAPPFRAAGLGARPHHALPAPAMVAGEPPPGLVIHGASRGRDSGGGDEEVGWFAATLDGSGAGSTAVIHFQRPRAHAGFRRPSPDLRTTHRSPLPFLGLSSDHRSSGFSFPYLQRDLFSHLCSSFLQNFYGITSGSSPLHLGPSPWGNFLGPLCSAPLRYGPGAKTMIAATYAPPSRYPARRDRRVVRPRGVSFLDARTQDGGV